jgi:hypothetical protein
MLVDGVPATHEQLCQVDECTRLYEEMELHGANCLVEERAAAAEYRLQAEAQAPTTATSVLTELAPAFKTTSWLSAYLADCAGDPEDNDSLMTMGEVRNVLLALLTMRDRLTVGAPAPAPTMPTKKDVLTFCPERTPSQAQAQTTAAQAYTRTASSGGPGVDMCWIIGGQTAALTEAVYAWVRDDLSAGAQMQIGIFVQKLIDRLTGAPAPAPTMPTREQIARVIAKDDGCDLGYSQEFVRCIREIHNCGCAKRADAILALFAEGDTP